VDLNAGFVLAGMATTLLGPLVPVLARRWGLGDATVATLFTTQYACSTTVTLLSSSLVVRFDATRSSRCWLAESPDPGTDGPTSAVPQPVNPEVPA